MADNDNEHHNQGEKDAAEYAGYNPPHDWADTNLTHDHVKEEYQKDNDDYGKGWENGRNQRD